MRNPPNSKFQIPNSTQRGFTLIEILIAVAITVFLTSQVLLYTRSGERQIALFVEKQKIAGLLFRAKSLAVSAYNTGEANCGYGMEIDYQNGEYSIFTYRPPPFNQDPTEEECNAVRGGQLVPPGISYFSDRTKINPQIEFPVFGSLPADAIRYVLFIPPDPTVAIKVGQNGDSSSGPGKIYLNTIDGASGSHITVNTAGQVDF